MKRFVLIFIILLLSIPLVSCGRALRIIPAGNTGVETIVQDSFFEFSDFTDEGRNGEVPIVPLEKTAKPKMEHNGKLIILLQYMAYPSGKVFGFTGRKFAVEPFSKVEITIIKYGDPSCEPITQSAVANKFGGFRVEFSEYYKGTISVSITAQAPGKAVSDPLCKDWEVTM